MLYTGSDLKQHLCISFPILSKALASGPQVFHLQCAMDELEGFFSNGFIGLDIIKLGSNITKDSSFTDAWHYLQGRVIKRMRMAH